MTTQSYRGGQRCRSEFGAQLLRRGMTSAWLAGKLGVNEQTVRSWRMLVRRHGRLVPRRTPSLGHLEKLVEVLGVERTKTLTATERVLRWIRRPVANRQEDKP